MPRATRPAIAPGEIVAINGSGLGPSKLSVAATDRVGATLQLNGVVVLVDGSAAQIFYVSAANFRRSSPPA